MRVVAGRARGRVLQAPPGSVTRPTGDRVREAIFGILTSMDAIADAAVVDLFAGSGALGIEALSRGAASATFVDQDRRATEVIRANLAVLDEAGRLGRVVRAEVVGWVRRLPPAVRLGLVFADPPYAFDRWTDLLGGLVAVADLVVAESGAGTGPGSGVAAEWETVRSRQYGSTLVTILRPLAVPGLSEAAGLQPAHDQRRGGI